MMERCGLPGDFNLRTQQLPRSRQNNLFYLSVAHRNTYFILGVSAIGVKHSTLEHMNLLQKPLHRLHFVRSQDMPEVLVQTERKPCRTGVLAVEM